MAITHIVWMKFHQDVDRGAIDGHLAALSRLADRLDVIQSLSLGPNFTDRANGYTHGMVVKLADKAALHSYATDPRHVEVATALRADADLLALDYEYVE